jgi:F420-dependent oxidoreductase-like protein
VKLGLHVVAFDWPGGPQQIGPTLAEIGRTADQAGVDSITLMDHYFQLPVLGAADRPMLEGYTGLAFLAGHTSRVRLHLLVTGVTYRYPGLLAKIVSTLDVVSGGRARLGLGAAWYEREHKGLGVPYPSLAERFERLEETLQIVRQMWSEENGPFEGRHYQLAETINSPQPLQEPHPPIMIGGGGERKTLRLVATYADAWNVPVNPNAEGLTNYEHKLRVLRQHCERVGRDFDTIEKSILYAGAPPSSAASADQFLEAMAVCADLGVTDVHVMPFGPDPLGVVAALGELVIPGLGAL